MRKSFQTTLILVALLGGLCAWFFYYEQKVRPEKTKIEEVGKQFTSYEVKDVQEIELTRIPGVDLETTEAAAKPVDLSKKETVKLKKVGGEWFVTSPVEAPADDYVVEGMVTALTQNKQERVVDEKPADPAMYGLKDAFVTVTVKKESNSPGETTYLGKNTPVGTSLYARSGTNPAVYRAPRALRTALDKDLKTIRRKALITTSRFDVTEVEIAPAQGTSTVVKKGERDQWTLVKNDFPADGGEWNKTLTAILELKAVDYPAENPPNLSQYGLKPASFTVTVQTGTGEKAKRTQLFLGKAGKKFYAKTGDKPIVYEVEKDIFDKASRPWTDYRTMALATFDRFNVKRIKLERGKDTLEFLKENNAWNIPLEPTQQIDSAKVDTLLSALQDTKLVKYADGKSGIGAPSLVVRLYEKKDDKEIESAVLMFAKPSGKEVLASRQGLKTPFFVKAEDLSKINRAKASFFPAPAEPQKKS